MDIINSARTFYVGQFEILFQHPLDKGHLYNHRLCRTCIIIVYLEGYESVYLESLYCVNLIKEYAMSVS